MKALILKEIDEDMTPEEFRANELAMKAFGLLPRDFNLKEALAQVYAEEVAAFYDPKTKTMHLIEEPKAEAKKPPSFLERLFGKKQDFDKDENKTVIAHELTHALADQHYDLDAMQKAVKKDDDRSLALDALIEGEATLAMFGAGMDDWQGEDITKLPAERLELTFNLLSPFLPFMGGGNADQDRAADHQRVDDLSLFPGNGLLRQADQQGGLGGDRRGLSQPAALDRTDPPPREVPRASSTCRCRSIWVSLKPGEGWKEVGRNVLGEMQLGVMLRKHGGKTAAPGWDGDRYAVFEGPKDKLGLVWLSTWDSEHDAREFLDGYVAYQTSKVGRSRQAAQADSRLGLAQPRRPPCMWSSGAAATSP